MESTLDIIRRRHSARSFDGRSLDERLREGIRGLLVTPVPCPFGTRPRFALLAGAGTSDIPGTSSGRIGTYGVIKDAPAYIVGCCDRRQPYAFVDFGYAMEAIVLGVTAMGLGSCWLGGLFDRSNAGATLSLGEGEIVPAMSPVGYEASRRTIADRIIRFSAKSHQRKPWNQLFFRGSWDTPLDALPGGNSHAEPWAEVLEAVRMGPSASNKQPWRIVLSGDMSAMHLYLYEERVYTRAIPGVLLQDMDAGIAMRHADEALSTLGFKGSWERLEKEPCPGPAPLRYMASWLAD